MTTMTRRWAAAVLVVAGMGLAGCGSTYINETRIAGRPVVARAKTPRISLGTVLNQERATFTVDRQPFTVTEHAITWADGQSIALPPGWKRLDLLDRETHIEVQADGKPLGEIPIDQLAPSTRPDDPFKCLSAATS